MANHDHEDGEELSPEDEELSRLLKETADRPPEEGGRLVDVCRALGIEDALLPPTRQRAQGVEHPTSTAPRTDRYEDPRLLSRGAMGEIFSVRDPELQRRVARKVLRRDKALSRDALERFLQEARITGLLEHPNIVPVHELGLDSEGNPYFTMKEVAGRSLDDLVSEKRSESNELLRIFLKVCDAVAFAHSRGVIHRDLKPANVMVGAFGEVLVMDWGVAKVVGQPGAPKASCPLPNRQNAAQTVAGVVVGTPAYMSPEQARGEIERIGPASDVWALGAVLYEILTGVPPVQGSNRADVLDRLRRGEVVPPRDRFPDRDVSRELDAVVRRAMASRPEDRYSSVQALAEDVRAFLENRMVTAADYGLLAPVGKWMRRNPALTSVLFLALVVLAAMGAAFFWSVDVERRRALDAEEEARVSQQLEAIQRRRAEAALAWSLYDQARAYEEAGRLDEAAAVLDALDGRAEVDAVPDLALRIARLSLAARGWRGERAVWRHDAPVTAGAIMPDYASYLLGDAGGNVVLRDATTGNLLARTAAHEGAVLLVGFDPSGKLALSAGEDERLLAWRLPGLDPLGEAELRGRFLAIAITPGGSEAVASTDRGLFRLRWSEEGGRLSHHSLGILGGPVTAAAFIPRGDRLVVGRGSHPAAEIAILEWPTARLLRSWPAHDDVIRVLDLDHERGLLLSGSEDKTLALWNLDTSRRIHRLAGHEYGVKSAALSPGARRAVSGSFDRTVRSWDLATGESGLPLTGHAARITWVSFLDEDRWLSASRDASVRVWSERPDTRLQTGLRGGIFDLRFTPDGRSLVVSSEAPDGTHPGLLLDLEATGELSSPTISWSGGPPALLATGIAWLDAGRMTLADLRGNEIAKAPAGELPSAVYVLDTRGSPGDEAVLFCLREVERLRPLLVRWDLERQTSRVVRLGSHKAEDCAILAEEAVVVTAGEEEIRAVSITDGTVLWTVTMPEIAGPLFAHGPANGRILLADRESGSIVVLDAANGRILQRMEGLARSVLAASMMPGGRVAVLGDAARNVRFVDLERGAELRTLTGHDADVQAVAVSPDGHLLASGDRNGVLRLWRLVADEGGHEPPARGGRNTTMGPVPPPVQASRLSDR